MALSRRRAVDGAKAADDEIFNRGRFFKRAGGLGLAVAAVGELLLPGVATARTAQVDRVHVRRAVQPGVQVPDYCTGTLTCTRCNACCGHPCTPYGLSYCYHCVSNNCGSSYY